MTVCQTITAHCQKCDSADIRERNVATAFLPVTKWHLDGKVFAPDHFDLTNAWPDWETDDGVDLYSCGEIDCGWKGDLTALVIRGGGNG